AAHRTRLVEGLVGIPEKKRTTLGEFIKNRFEPWAKGRFEHSPGRTWIAWYDPSIRTLQNYPSLCNRLLSEITSEHIADFAAHVRAKGLAGKPPASEFGQLPIASVAANAPPCGRMG